MIYTVRGFRTYPPVVSSGAYARVRACRAYVDAYARVHTTFQAGVKNDVK